MMIILVMYVMQCYDRHVILISAMLYNVLLCYTIQYPNMLCFSIIYFSMIYVLGYSMAYICYDVIKF